MTAKSFCGNYVKIPDSLERVIFDIYLDLDFTNDTGSYILLKSDAVSEDEWLLGPGAEFEIGEITPKLMTNSSKERAIDSTKFENEEDKEKYLENKDQKLNQNLVYVIKLFK